MSGSDFTAYLTGLTIRAYDLSVDKAGECLQDKTKCFLLGTASGLADPRTGVPDPVNDVIIDDTSILQHYVDITDTLSGIVTHELEAAATAIIVVPDLSTYHEYPDPSADGSFLDIVLEFKRGGFDLIDHTLEYNATIRTVPWLPTDTTNQKDYFAMSASTYVTLPGIGIDPSTDAYVDLPANGQPPEFESLRKAVNRVLEKDPDAAIGNLENHSPLTSAQSRQVAGEIIWNRKMFPQPPEPIRFGEMYTSPPADGESDSNKLNTREQARKQFEADITGYHATHEADVIRLTGYVFAASAAVACEKLSKNASRVGLTFPIIVSGSSAPPFLHSTVALNPADLAVSFVVPAAYFYALGATLPSQISPQQRFDIARLELEPRLLSDLQIAAEAGIIKTPAKPVTVPAAAEVNPDQAFRRLAALGSTLISLPDLTVAAPIFPLVKPLVEDWLDYADPSANMENDDDFWDTQAGFGTALGNPDGYLQLVLDVVTNNHGDTVSQNLITAIRGPPHNPTSIEDLVAITDKQWKDFFLGPAPPPGTPPRISILPLFTMPGTPEERVDSLIRHFRKLFIVPFDAAVANPGSIPAVPGFELSIPDIFNRFTSSYFSRTGVHFAFGAGNLPAPQQVIDDVFPADTDAQAWLVQALDSIDALYLMTDIGLDDLRFSLMEALFSRGFTNKEDVNALSKSDFQEALTGTVAYIHANEIYSKAGATGPTPPQSGAGFKSLNPDGLLTNCVPPLHHSPLGPVEYLHELLKISQNSSCDTPMPDDDEDHLQDLIANRRGPLGNLHATQANLQTPVPLIDLVNESLEAMASGIPGSTDGAVYDTASDELGGHKLRNNEQPCREIDGQIVFLHDPATLFAAVPEHSSPATPVKKSAGYEALKKDFTSPVLPYSQALDVSRSYLCQLGTNRYDIMRRCREKITEFVIDPLHEPSQFQPHLWRYPVRIEIAREYVCVSQEEYDLLFTHDIVFTPTPDRLLLRELYGFNSDEIDGKPWTQIVLKLSEFLKRTGLTYCEFLDLWHSDFVHFSRAGEDPQFPECEPCCLDNLVIEFDEAESLLEALWRLAVFIRLWRKPCYQNCHNYTFTQLRDICEALQLFKNGSINADFIRQFASFQILRDNWGLALLDCSDDTNIDGTGADRTHLLALWVGKNARKWSWAVRCLLNCVQDRAQARHQCSRRSPQFIKLLEENLDSLSLLAGFDPSLVTDTWNALPTHTLRFVEILTKLYSSDFGIGEILFLFTADDHLQGDDPFPVADENESFDSPLHHPDDDVENSLWALRRKLLNVCLPEKVIEEWSWTRIEGSLRTDFGFYRPEEGPDPIDSLVEHFFPCVLESSNQTVNLEKRQYRVDLTDTPPLMWNTPAEGPFRYDSSRQQLWTQIPIRDHQVNAKLCHIRQLNPDPLNPDPSKPDEQNAVRELYFLPRIDLAPFAFIFSDFAEADECLIQEEIEGKRWSYFQRQFAYFHARCEIIAEHLASHVAAVTGRENVECTKLARYLLLHLMADENLAKTVWETDTGLVPDVTWRPKSSGGAFAALLGLVGTGLLGEFTLHDDALKWREVRGPVSAFGYDNDYWNSPIPTIIPSMSLTFSPDDERFATLRNGFAIRDLNGEDLYGAQGFTVRWRGVLLIEKEGAYRFWAGGPTPNGVEPNFEDAKHRDWHMVLKRGQKTWVLLNHNWGSEDAPAYCSQPLLLKPGAYSVLIEFRQPKPNFSVMEHVFPQHTGFQVKYCGPDSGYRIIVIPKEQLFRDLKEPVLFREVLDPTLGAQIDLSGAAKVFLELLYTSTLRDIRRTYQRAFKAILFSYRFGLSPIPVHDGWQSEIGYLLDNGQKFLGSAYYRVPGAFETHHVYFNFNFLPIKDSYHSPVPGNDLRVQPSNKRKQALFDCWEHIFDYVTLRKETACAKEPPAWLLFYEAVQKQPDDAAQLLRHLGIDIRHGPLVLHYYQGYNITSSDLEDERWAVRIWKVEKLIRDILLCFMPKMIGEARPHLWASDDPNIILPDLVVPGKVQSGNGNLTKFYRDGCIENGEPRRYEDIKSLNDGLRDRARISLLAYLCGMNRVTLPWDPSSHASTPRDLMDLLLQDVEAGICQSASRIEDGINSVHTFVQRARLGLEPGLKVSPSFVQAWERRFATFHIWEACKRREVYLENWIEWDELEEARKTEAFLFLENELRRSTLTVPVPGGLEWWPNEPPPDYQSLVTIQAREQARIEFFRPGLVPEGLGLLGTPQRDARPSWLAPVVSGSEGENGNGDVDDDVVGNGIEGTGFVDLSTTNSDVKKLPLWIQAAVRLGTRFVRVAAAAIPPASAQFIQRNPKAETGCCAECGRSHAPTMDEYYFWLQDSKNFDKVEQDANLGAEAPDDPEKDPTSYWHQPDKLARLLYWDPGPMVHLFWCRVHNSEFQQPRRSDEGLRMKVGVTAELDFKGRTGDSLRFEVTGADPILGYDPTVPGADPENPGFRYDLPTDTAIVVPRVFPLDVVPPAPPTEYPGGLKAYPFFIYFTPGSHLEPPSIFSVALTVAGVLRAHCRFEAALKWYELFFNPLQQDNTWVQCQVAPNGGGVPVGVQPSNGEMEGVTVGSTGAGAAPISSNGETEGVTVRSTGASISTIQRGDDVPCCPSAPVPDYVGRLRAITLLYLEALMQWGDALMCKNSPESFQQSRVIFDTLGKVLGSRPTTINVQNHLENLITVSDFVSLEAPLNPRLLSLYDRQRDRLALIHNCLNARRLRNGKVNLDMSFWGNSPFRDGWQTTTQTCQDENDWCMWCCSPYRFVFQVQKALELAGEVRGLGAALLTAYEKGDAEYLASLRATHEGQLLHLTLEIRQNQWREADWQLQALKKTKEGAQTRKRYYERLIKDGLNEGEIGYQSMTETSMTSRAQGNISEGISQSMGTIPDFWFGVSGMGPHLVNDLPIGTKLAAVFAAAARIMNTIGEITNTNGSLDLTEGGWDRREDEWKHQSEVIGIEIEQIERQILAAERRRDIALRELNNHQRQIEHSIEVQNFLRDKFTNHELYLFLQQETSAMHYQAYELALYTARQAQNAFNYERGYTARTFIPTIEWDNLHEGLMAGERLQLAVRQMEKAYLDANCREYELSKHISLRLNFPLAFLQLQVTGCCEIEIPEWMFDHDYPGHYMRRIKDVRVTIPCVVGPYTGIHSRLTLLSSITRVDPRLIDPAHSCCDNSKCCCCNAYGSTDGYTYGPEDPRIVKNYAATEAIATSTGQNDAGLFELNFRDERYLPFEFAGAISRWRIELPQDNNQFNVETMSDVILHMDYTAREGGTLLKKEANKIAQHCLPGAGLRLFDLRKEFPDGSKLLEDCGGGKELKLRITPNMFPFIQNHKRVEICRLELFFEAQCMEPDGHQVVEFLCGHKSTHDKNESCNCGVRNIYCACSSEWPCFYHGILDICLEPITSNDYQDLGIFKFSSEVRKISRAYLICGYNVK